uniref:G protein gamma domain-containing protein n=1 Tax=Sander lucioperca TaxID=283035 RepID=A0A8D0CNU2_SANLU
LTVRMARDMSDKEILKMELEQLKKEVNTMAANCAETVSFVEALVPNDPLIKGVSDEKNPYKGDKGGCIVT